MEGETARRPSREGSGVWPLAFVTFLRRSRHPIARRQEHILYASRFLNLTTLDEPLLHLNTLTMSGLALPSAGSSSSAAGNGKAKASSSANGEPSKEAVQSVPEITAVQGLVPTLQ